MLAEYAGVLDRAQQRVRPRLSMSPPTYDALRMVTIASVGAWALGAEHPAIKATANACFGALQVQVVEFHDELWSYTSHLNAYLGLMSLFDTRREANPALASTILCAMQAIYASIYLQSGVSKLIGAGWRWTDGATLRAAWGEFGTPLGKWLSRADPRLAAGASTLALAFELGFAPVLLLFWRRRAVLGIASAAFHCSIKASMNISFWHFSWFSVPLFAVPNSIVERTANAFFCPGPKGAAKKVISAATVLAMALLAPRSSHLVTHKSSNLRGARSYSQSRPR